MKKLVLLLTILPLVALADVVDPFSPGIIGLFLAVSIVAVSFTAGGLIIICRFLRSSVGRLLFLCGLVILLLFMLVHYVNCTACSGRGFVRGLNSEKCRCCKGSGEHFRWIFEKCQMLSEVEERIRIDAVQERFDEASDGGVNKRFHQYERDDGVE